MRLLTETKTATTSERLFRSCVVGVVPFFLLQRYVAFTWAALAVAALIGFFFFLETLRSRLKNFSTSGLTLDPNSLDHFVKRVRGVQTLHIASSEIEIGDTLVYSDRDVIQTDGLITQGVALIDESSVTGESAAVVREAGDLRNFATEGTTVLSGSILVEVTHLPKSGFKAQIRQLLGKKTRSDSLYEQSAFKTSLLVSGLLVTITFGVLFAATRFGSRSADGQGPRTLALLTLIVATCLLIVWLLPIFQRLLSLAFLDRLLHRHLIPKSISALETAGSIDLVLMSADPNSALPDQASVKELIPAPNVKIEELARMAQLAALCDDQPIERAIIKFVKQHFSFPTQLFSGKHIRFISATHEFDVKGVHMFNEDGEDGVRAILLGPLTSIRRHVEGLGRLIPETLVTKYESILKTGDEALFVCDGGQATGLIHLSKRARNAQENAVFQFQSLGIQLVAISERVSTIDAVIEERRHEKRVAFIGMGEEDLGAVEEADLGLTSNFGSERLSHVASVVCVSNGTAPYRHLFTLGRELLTARRSLNRNAFAIGAAVWLVLLPLAFLLATGLGDVNHVFNPLRFQSAASAIFACGITALLALSVVGAGMLGLHDHRGPLFRFGRSIFESEATPIKLFLATLATSKGLDLFLDLLN